MDWLSSRQTLIIGHRGASADMPENTLAAFALAIEQGADGIEFDVRLCADGRPVIIHDSTVDRVCDDTGRVADLTVAELQALDLGQGQTVPTLDDLFQMLGPATLYNLELKTAGLSDDLVLAVADRIEAHHLETRVLVSSFSAATVRQARRHLPRSVPVALVRQHRAMAAAHRFVAAEADHPESSLVDAELMAWAAARDLRLHAWTVDDPEEARRLMNLGVNGIITNRPGFIRHIVGLD